MLTSDGLAFNLVLALGLMLLARECSARVPWQRTGGILLMLTLTAVYVGWRYEVTLPDLAGSAESTWAWAFFLGEIALIAYQSWSWTVLRRVSDHSRQADWCENRMRRPMRLPPVDIFVPTYEEGPEILAATIRGALALDYAGEVSVWILDDNRRAWLEAMCVNAGVGYLARPTNAHGKAGNLNYALPRTRGEYIVVIDADFVLAKNFLYRTLGFLIFDQHVGLVQTPQLFRNPDPVQHNLHGATAWTEEQNFFMTVVQPGRDAHACAFCVGSGWVIRRATLEALGGFPQQSICEDLEISYVLKARGLRTLYLNEPLACGLAPESVAEYIKQRVRWCCGTLQHLFLKSGPLRAGELSWRDRLFYLEPIAYWLTYPFVLLVVLAPVVFWLTGIPAMHNVGDGFYFLLLPRLIVTSIVMYWLSDGKVLPVVWTVHKILPAFHLVAAVSTFFLAPFGRPFSVTVKGHRRDQPVIAWSIVWIFLVLAVLLGAGVIMNVTGWREVVKPNEVTVFDMVWTLFSLTALVLCILACVERPRGAGSDPSGQVAHGSPVRALKALLYRIFV